MLAVLGWMLVEGLVHFDPAIAFDFSGAAAGCRADFAVGLGAAMILAMYSYLGYYNVCYIGDEVRDPGRPSRGPSCSAPLLVIVLFLGLHLAMLGMVPWQTSRRVAAVDVQPAGRRS